MNKEIYLVRSEVLTGFDDLVRELGGDPIPLYRKAGLAAALMSNPDHMVPCANVSALLDIAAKALGRSDFGLLLGSRRKVFQIGLLWSLFSHCPSVEQALKAATRHLHLHNRGVLWNLDVENNHALLSRADRMPSDIPTFQWAVYSTSSMFGALKLLCGKNWWPTSVCFIHSPPVDSRVYNQFFGVKVEFNRGFNLIDFPASDLYGELAGRNSNLYIQLNKQVQALENKYQRQEDIYSKIKLLIEQSLHTAECTQTKIAAALSMHPKALQRKLKSHGSTFRELRAEARLDVAERYLKDSEIPLTIVADILGFSELSSFSHAFKIRHGLSPGEWRKRAKAGAA